ncbi:MAG: hypothetical protein AB7V58_03700 [Solirubrobacterales bacterium]
MRRILMTAATGAVVAAGLVAGGTAAGQAPATPTAPGARAACVGGDFAGIWQRGDGSTVTYTQTGRVAIGLTSNNQTSRVTIAGATATGTYTLSTGTKGKYSQTIAPDLLTLATTVTNPDGTPGTPSNWTFKGCDPLTVSSPVGANLRLVIPAPQLASAGPTSAVAPGIISLGSLATSRCVLVKVSATEPARILATIFSGKRSKRIFGQKLVVFSKPGSRRTCIPVPRNAKTISLKTSLNFALGYSKGARPNPNAKPTKPAIKRIKLVP